MSRPEPYGRPRVPAVLFGCDGWGKLIDSEPPYENQKGTIMRRLLIVPSGLLIKSYPYLQRPGMNWIKTGDGDAIWCEYPDSLVHEPNLSKINAIVRVHCGFDGRPTYYTKLHEKYTTQIDNLMKELDAARISAAVYLEEIRHLQESTGALIKKQTEIYKMAGGGKSGDESEGENTEESSV